MDTPTLLPCPFCGSNTVDKATCLSWRTEFVGPLRRYRCALHPPVTPSEPHAFTEGQSITAEGIQGPHAHPNGAYVVDSVNPGTITP
jgi:hypothetical protein